MNLTPIGAFMKLFSSLAVTLVMMNTPLSHACGQSANDSTVVSHRDNQKPILLKNLANREAFQVHGEFNRENTVLSANIKFYLDPKYSQLFDFKQTQILNENCYNFARKFKSTLDSKGMFLYRNTETNDLMAYKCADNQVTKLLILKITK